MLIKYYYFKYDIIIVKCCILFFVLQVYNHGFLEDISFFWSITVCIHSL